MLCVTSSLNFSLPLTHKKTLTANTCRRASEQIRKSSSDYFFFVDAIKICSALRQMCHVNGHVREIDGIQIKSVCSGIPSWDDKVEDFWMILTFLGGYGNCRKLKRLKEIQCKFHFLKVCWEF